MLPFLCWWCITLCLIESQQTSEVKVRKKKVKSHLIIFMIATFLFFSSFPCYFICCYLRDVRAVDDNNAEYRRLKTETVQRFLSWIFCCCCFVFYFTFFSFLGVSYGNWVFFSFKRIWYVHVQIMKEPIFQQKQTKAKD